MQKKQFAFTPNEYDNIMIKEIKPFCKRETGKDNPASIMRFALAQTYKEAIKNEINPDLINKYITDFLNIPAGDPEDLVVLLQQMFTNFGKELLGNK
jgi:hypothetical protein